MLQWLAKRKRATNAAASGRDAVLVCDDDYAVREAYKLILSERYDLKLAAHGREAIKLLKRQPIKVMILDLKMPELDGLAVLKQVRDTAPATRVIISTGYRSIETAQEAARLGCHDYLMKPFEPKDVLTAVRQAFDR